MSTVIFVETFVYNRSQKCSHTHFQKYLNNGFTNITITGTIVRNLHGDLKRIIYIKVRTETHTEMVQEHLQKLSLKRLTAKCIIMLICKNN